jgi:hypothetical protein
MRRFLPPLLLVVAGAVVLGATHGTAGTAAGMFVAGAGGVWLVSAVFFVIGRSEDLDRKRHPHG